MNCRLLRFAKWLLLAVRGRCWVAFECPLRRHSPSHLAPLPQIAHLWHAPALGTSYPCPTPGYPSPGHSGPPMQVQIFRAHHLLMIHSVIPFGTIDSESSGGSVFWIINTCFRPTFELTYYPIGIWARTVLKENTIKCSESSYNIQALSYS